MKDVIRTVKRKMLIDVANGLFHQNGYAETSISSIVAELNVTKPFFYNYFGNKQDILDTLMIEAADNMAAGVESVFSVERSAPEQLRALVSFYASHILTNRSITSIFEREQQHLSPEVRERVRHEHRSRERRIVMLIDEGVATGVFETRDAVMVANAIGGMVRACHRWYDPNGRLSVDEIRDNLAELALNMVKYHPTHRPFSSTDE